MPYLKQIIQASAAWWLEEGDAVFFVAGDPAQIRQVRWAGADQDR